MRKSFLLISTLLLSLLLVTLSAAGRADSSKPFLHPLFSDSMVLQRDHRDPVWGWSIPGQTITVLFKGKTYKAMAGSDGGWMTTIGPFKAGGPYTLTVSGPQKITLQNISIGDVWLCSGQSNMKFGIGNAANGPQEIAEANHPNVRLFTVANVAAIRPRQTIPVSATEGHWEVCSPQNISAGGWNGFSAVAYFFARDLEADTHVPIGVIDSSWSGTKAEAWTSSQGLNTMIDFQPAVAALQNAADNGGSTGNPDVVAALYNGMIAPLIPFAIKGVVWYQGEYNADRANQYRTLLPTLIKDWRTQFGEWDLPFLIVQLAGYEPGDATWPELREAQMLTALQVPETGIVTAIDVGDPHDIHPKNKQEVGRRLTLAAENMVYGKHVEGYGPIYKSMKIEGNSVRLSFDHLGGGLTAKVGGLLTGFTIAGKEGDFVPAMAKINGDSVVVSAPSVPQPAAVRYGWTGFPKMSLYSKEDLPAFPFRTDVPVPVPDPVLPPNAGPNLALGKSYACSNTNTYNFGTGGLTDGSWEPDGTHCFATNDNDTFPKNVTIDIGQTANVEWVMIGVPPFGATKTIAISISKDGQIFTDVGSHIFSQRQEEKHLFTFIPRATQFVRLTYPDHYNAVVGYPVTFSFTTECQVYAPIQ